MAESEFTPSDEKVLGLDPRRLLRPANPRPDVGTMLRTWTPPPGEQMARLLPQFDEFTLIGRGGMGAVYRARQPRLERWVAIKLLPAEAAADAAFAERFRTESRALARLQHPSIIAAHDSGQTGEGHLYLLMEFVEGRDLSQVLKDGPLELPRAVEIACAVCEALEFAHGRGIIHRDIKPANILMSLDGSVKVADFGLAWIREDVVTDESRLTVAGTMLGTPDYMAPEQRTGHRVDHRADLYSIGVVLYEMITGKLPLGSWDAPLRTSPGQAGIYEVLRKAMQSDPADRFQDASELRKRLLSLQSPSPGKRRVWLAVVGLVLLAGVLALAAAYLPVGKGTRDLSDDSATALQAAKIDPFQSLDLSKEIVFGKWHWLEGETGGTLALEHDELGGAKRISLPVRPGIRSYQLSFRLVLQDERADCGVILCAGAARTGLLLDVHSSSGIGLIKGQQWDQNEALVRQALPLNRSLLVDVLVQLAGERVSIVVKIDDAPFLKWEGPQSDLSLLERPPYGWAMPDPDSLGFASFNGAILIRDARVQILQ